MPTLPLNTPTIVADIRTEVGEGPLWHEELQAVLWLDVPAGTMYRFDPGTGQNTLYYQQDGPISGYTIQDDGSLLLFGDKGSAYHLRDGRTSTVIDQVDGLEEARWNDVVADPEGRVYCGTMTLPDGTARLYRLDVDGTLTLLADDLVLANGMDFSPDLSRMYLSDSEGKAILSFAYDRETGELSDRQKFVDGAGEEWDPDGLTVDADGTVWSARWNGSALIGYAPDGTEQTRIDMPAKKVTSIIFGGEDYETAYVTTASMNDTDENGEESGSLFAINLGVKGRPSFRSRIR